MKRLVWMPVVLGLMFLLNGCFETDFDFKTQVHPDGSVTRQTKIDGRGANMFQAPSEPGWTVKTWETKGGSAVLPNSVYHVLANGEFKQGALIPSDYQFDTKRQLDAWGDEEKAQAEIVGIKPPFEDNLYSRNKIEVRLKTGWLINTYVYKEFFQTAGEIEMLFYDLKEEIKKKRQENGDVLDENEITQLAKLRLEDDYLSQLRFSSEVTMPGKIIQSNAHQIEDGKAVWKFSMKDFANNYSQYTLKVVSRSLRMSGLILLIVLGGIILVLLTLFLAGMSKAGHSGRGKK